MLAYELYCENDKTKQDSGKGIPIKKIFIDHSTVTLDETTLSRYKKTSKR